MGAAVPAACGGGGAMTGLRIAPWRMVLPGGATGGMRKPSPLPISMLSRGRSGLVPGRRNSTAVAIRDTRAVHSACVGKRRTRCSRRPGQDAERPGLPRLRERRLGPPRNVAGQPPACLSHGTVAPAPAAELAVPPTEQVLRFSQVI